MKGIGELMREALSHERRGRWSAAAAAIAAALTAPRPPEPAKRGARRSGPTGIAPGTILRHTKRGVVEAECVVVGEGDFRVGGVSYPDLSSAANAAAASLGRKSKTLNGWVYWGVDRQGLDGDLDQTASETDDEGFDQTASDSIDDDELDAI